MGEDPPPCHCTGSVCGLLLFPPASASADTFICACLSPAYILTYLPPAPAPAPVGGSGWILWLDLDPFRGTGSLPPGLYGLLLSCGWVWLDPVAGARSFLGGDRDRDTGFVCSGFALGGPWTL